MGGWGERVGCNAPTADSRAGLCCRAHTRSGCCNPHWQHRRACWTWVQVLLLLLLLLLCDTCIASLRGWLRDAVPEPHVLLRYRD
jgi:hypothetical protein